MESKTSTPPSPDGIISALLDTLFDKDEVVSAAVASSLHSVGKTDPNSVISCCMLHLRKDSKSKTGVEDRIKLFTTVEKICQEVVQSVDPEIRNTLLDYCIAEICREKAPHSGCEKMANQIIVSIGTKFENEVMDKLFTRFDPSYIPSFYMVKTLGDLASSNPFGMVPFLKALLGSMLPMLDVIKQDVMKYIFAYSLACFAESILEYLANIDKAPDRDVSTDYFNTEFGTVCDVLLNSWIQTRDVRTKEQVVKALGVIPPLLSPSKLDEMAPKLITSLLHLYRRHNIPLPMIGNDIEMCYVSQSLCQVLEATIAQSSNAIVVVQIESILSTLFFQACIMPDYHQPTTLRNHNEILRCFATLAMQYPDTVIPFLLQKLDSSSEPVKVGTLTVIKHLVNACTQKIATKMASIFFALRLVLHDETNRVKKIVIQVIVAIAHHGYLGMDGGQALIQYVIRQCALPVSEKTREVEPRRNSVSDADKVTNEMLKGMAENVMSLLVTTVENIEAVLWPHLFEYLITLEFVAAVPTLCSSLASMGQKLKGTESLADKFTVDFEHNTNLPKPESLMARLCVLTGDNPNSKSVVPVLKLMKVVSVLINSNLVPLWDTVTMQFLSRLNESSEIELNDWQTQCLAFVNQSLIEIDDHKFTYKFGKALLKQMHLYAHSPENKSFFLLVLGSVVRRLAVKDFTTEAIDVIFAHLDHSNELDQAGCSYAIGQCAANHLDLVLVKLEQLAEGKKSGTLMNMLIGSVRSNAVEQERVRSTVILCYGSVTKYAPSQLLITRIETPILRTLASFYEASKEIVVRAAFLKAVAVIANSLHPDNLMEQYIFKRRNELLEEMLKILKDFHSSELQVELSLEAVAKLIKLDPILSEQDKEKIVSVSCKAVLPAAYSEKVTVPFHNVLEQILAKDKNDLATLLLLVNLLRKWLSTPSNELERKNGMSAVLHLLTVYFKNVGPADFKKFECFPTLVGIFTPRLFDSALSICNEAFSGIELLCLISNKLQARTSEEDSLLLSLGQLKDAASDGMAKEAAVEKFSKDLCSRIKDRNHSMMYLIEALVNSLPETVTESSIGCSRVFSFVIQCSGAELKQETPSILAFLLEVLPFISCAETRAQAYEVIKNLCSIHLSTVASSLIANPLPLSEVVVDVWKNLAAGSDLCASLVDWLLDVLSENELTETRYKNNVAAAARPLAVVYALQEIFSRESASVTAKRRFEDAYTILLIVTATYVDVERVAYGEMANGSKSGEVARKSSQKHSSNHLKPVRCGTQAIRALLGCAGESKVLDSVTEEQWRQMEQQETFAEGVAALSNSLCLNSPKNVPSIVRNLTKYLTNTSPNCRVAAVAFFAEVLTHKSEEHTLSEPLLNTLLNMLSDPSPTIRRICIRGLGRFYSHPHELALKFSNAIVSAFINGLEDSEDANGEIVLESLRGLLTTLDVIDVREISELMVPLALRLKTHFDKEKPSLQAASIEAFGKLASLAAGTSPHPLIDQAYSSLIPLLIYLNDSNEEVVKASKHALRSIGPAFGTPHITTLFKKSLNADSSLHYGDFISALSKLMISDMPDKLDDFVSSALGYLKGERQSSQSSSVVLLGFLLGNQPKDQRRPEFHQRVVSILIMLLRSSVIPEIRIKAAEALSLM